MADKEYENEVAETRRLFALLPQTQRRNARRFWHPCFRCGDYFLAARSTARYCSDRCRVAANREWRRKFGLS
jgi:hypothetical protein